jgi:hypothetical protein
MAVTINYVPYTSGPITQSNGIISSGDCAVTASGGMNISIATGEAYIRGDFTHTGDPQVLTVTNNASGSTRYDLVVIHVDLAMGTAEYRINAGNLDPTQNNSVWELPLAGIAVANGAVSLVGAIQDLRVISNDSTPKTLITLTKSTDTTITSGQELTLAWDTPTQPNDIYRFALLNTYIRPRVSAFYNVQSQMRWAPSVTSAKPVVFSVYMVNPTDFRTTEIYRVSSAQTVAGDVNFTFNQVLQIPQGYYVYMSVKNTTDTTVTVKSVASTSPLFRVQFTTYPIQLF